MAAHSGTLPEDRARRTVKAVIQERADMPESEARIRVNRAPVLTLWAAV